LLIGPYQKKKMTDSHRQDSFTNDSSGLPAFLPLYQQIKVLLLQKLQAGDWTPGELIPSEIDLAQYFKVSQGTVRKAVDALANENLLIRQQGKGTFVATHAKETTQYRFLRLTADKNTASPDSQKVKRAFISLDTHLPPPKVSAALALEQDEQVIHIKRTLAFEVEPVILEEIWLPLPAFKGLTLQKMINYDGPTYALFEMEFGIRMVRANEKIKATIAKEDETAFLKIASGTPLLSVERVAFTYNDRPMEFRRALCNTNFHHYRNSLS
jgi:GntR family transcriptional regulator